MPAFPSAAICTLGSMSCGSSIFTWARNSTWRSASAVCLLEWVTDATQSPSSRPRSRGMARIRRRCRTWRSAGPLLKDRGEEPTMATLHLVPYEAVGDKMNFVKNVDCDSRNGFHALKIVKSVGAATAMDDKASAKKPANPYAVNLEEVTRVLEEGLQGILV